MTKIENRILYSSEYIQNCTNWCWAVACRMVGEQFKRNNPHINFQISLDEGIHMERKRELRQMNNVWLTDLTGVRTDVVQKEGSLFLLNEMQRSIVKNANTICPDCDGNWPGDDEAKERGIKYVVTGKCDSDLIQIASLGFYDSKDSLLDYYEKKIYDIFSCNGYIIGNAILYPREICHSFVLLDWTKEDKILVFDSWNGLFSFLPVEGVFRKGISSTLGNGVIKWIQYIV